jgi:hypothetical protein
LHKQKVWGQRERPDITCRKASRVTIGQEGLHCWQEGVALAAGLVLLILLLCCNRYICQPVLLVRKTRTYEKWRLL